MRSKISMRSGVPSCGDIWASTLAQRWCTWGWDIVLSYLSSDIFLRQIADDRQLELFALIGFEHQEYPQHQLQEAQKGEQHQPYEGDVSDDHEQYGQPAEGDHRLHRVESDKFVLLLEQEKNQPGNPANQIAKQSRNALIQSRGSRLDILSHDIFLL